MQYKHMEHNVHRLKCGLIILQMFCFPLVFFIRKLTQGPSPVLPHPRRSGQTHSLPQREHRLGDAGTQRHHGPVHQACSTKERRQTHCTCTISGALFIMQFYTSGKLLYSLANCPEFQDSPENLKQPSRIKALISPLSFQAYSFTSIYTFWSPSDF